MVPKQLINLPIEWTDIKLVQKGMYQSTILLVELVSVILQKLFAELLVITNLVVNFGRLAMRLTLGFCKQKLNKNTTIL